MEFSHFYGAQTKLLEVEYSQKNPFALIALIGYTASVPEVQKGSQVPISSFFSFLQVVLIY